VGVPSGGAVSGGAGVASGSRCCMRPCGLSRGRAARGASGGEALKMSGGETKPDQVDGGLGVQVV
jgi:hypothetical protein